MRALRIPPLGLLAVLVALLLTGGCEGEERATRGSLAELAPASTELYVEGVLKPDLDAREALEGLAERFPSGRRASEEIAERIDRRLDALAKPSARPLSFGRDVSPWLGDRFAASAEGLGSRRATEWSVALETSDTEAARAALERFAASSSTPVTETEVAERGVWTVGRGGQVIGLIEDDLLIASDRERFERVAALADGEDERSLAAREDFSYFVGTAEGSRAIVFAWLDSARAIDAAAERLGEPRFATRFSGLAGQAGADLREPASFAVGVTSDVALFDSSFGLLEREAPDPTADALLLEQMPAESLIAGSCSACVDVLLSDVAGDPLEEALGAGGTARTVEAWVRLRDELSGLRPSLGSAVGFVYAPRPTELAGGVVVEVRNPVRVGGAIERLRAAANGLEGARVARFSLRRARADGFTVRLPSLPEALVVAATNDRLVIALGEDALRRALDPEATLGDVAAFADFSDQLGDEFAPSALVDIARIKNLLAVSPEPGMRRLARAIAPINRAGSGTRVVDGRLITRAIVAFEGFDR